MRYIKYEFFFNNNVMVFSQHLVANTTVEKLCKSRQKDIGCKTTLTFICWWQYNKTNIRLLIIKIIFYRIACVIWKLWQRGKAVTANPHRC